MSVTSGFYNSLNGDRRYTAEQMSELINTLVNDGVFPNVGTAFAVTAAGGSAITIGIGRAWFDSAWVYNDAILPMVVRDAEVLQDRIDAVVIEVNHSEAVRDGQIRFVNGIPSNSPQRPDMLHTDEIGQYPLVYIYRKAGANEVLQKDITNMIGTSACPYITGILKTQDIDKIVAQWENEFDVWFDGIKSILDGDVAAEIALRFLELEGKFDTLASERSVYVMLQDSNRDAIKGGYGTDILGRTTFNAENEKQTVVPQLPVACDQFKVGDILTTIRTNLGDNWLLCNGAELDVREYTELASSIQNRTISDTSKWKSKTFSSLGNMGSSYVEQLRPSGKIIYDGKEYASFCFAYDTANDITERNRAVLLRASKPTGTWTETDIWRGSGTYNSGIWIEYVNGYYILGGAKQSTSSDYIYARIAYSTSLDGPWSFKDLWYEAKGSSGQCYSSITYITYVNGYYVCCGLLGGQIQIVYSTSLDGIWTPVTWTPPSDSHISISTHMTHISSIVYDGSQYIMSVTHHNTANTPAAAYVFYGPTLASMTSMAAVWNGSTNVLTNKISYVTYIDGKYIAGGSYRTVSNESEIQRIAYANSLTGPWTVKDFPKPSNIKPNTFSYVTDIKFIDGVYYAICVYKTPSNDSDSYVCASNNLAGPWEATKTFVGMDDRYQFIDKFDDAIVMTAERLGSSNRNLVDCQLKLVDLTKFNLPSISSTASTYDYIKARSD